MRKKKYKGKKPATEEPYIDSDFFLTLQNPVWAERFKKFIKISNTTRDLLEIWWQAWNKPWFMKFFAIVSSLGTLKDFVQADLSYATYLTSRRYKMFPVFGFRSLAYSLFSPQEKTTTVQLENCSLDFYGIAENKQVAFIGKKNSLIHHPWLSENYTGEEFLDEISKRFWKNFESSVAILDIYYNPEAEEDQPRLSPLESTVGEYVGPQNEHEILKIWRKYQQSGLNRTLLLHGPTGTGKSTIAMRVAQLLGGRILKIDLRSLNELGFSVARMAFRIVQPNILLLDDLDRFEDEYTLLSFLEELNRSRNDFLVILTANRVMELGSTVLRPGRIDSNFEYRLPGEEQRLLIAELYMGKWPLNDEATAEGIMRITEGLSSAHIYELIRNASVMELSPDQITREAKTMVEFFEKLSR